MAHDPAEVGSIDRVTAATAQLINEFVSGDTVAALLVVVSPAGRVQAEILCNAALGPIVPLIVRQIADALPAYADSLEARQEPPERTH